MPTLLHTLLAFAVALIILIAVHEWGHYRMARACGVKVLRFSIGMGRPLLRWRGGHAGETEFTLSALPIGGYVRMLDEREGDVPSHERHRAFNQRPLRQRAAIVAAGPAANLILAVALYAVVQFSGVMEPLARIAAPAQGSLAAAAGLAGRDEITAIAPMPPARSAAEAQTPDMSLGHFEPGWQQISSFEQLRWHLLQLAIDGQDAAVQVQRGAGNTHMLRLELSQIQPDEVGAQLMRRIGITAPWMAPVIEGVVEDGAAARAGLQAGDVVYRMGSVSIEDAAQLRALIAATGEAGQPQAQDWLIGRNGQTLQLTVQPEYVPASADGKRPAHGRVGAFIGQPPEMVRIELGVLESVAAAVVKVWDVSRMSLQMMARMLTGQASLDNLSSPIMIADHAGRSASLGWQSYVAFLALVSVSLGVLNLLPLPVLDGGHLVYYLWEALRGKPVSEAWMLRLQKIGVAILLLIMSIAVFNDINRLWLH